MMRWITIILVLMCCNISAQDLENINVKIPDVYLDGNISVGMRSFGSSRSSTFQNSGLGYLASARLNLHIHNLSLPFSYRMGDQLSLPSLPSFKYWGLSPKYKSMQLHIGHRSMRFSDHTLAGIQTYGVGFEITRKRLHIQFSRGSLNRQRPERVIYNSRIRSRKEKKYTAASVRIGSTKNHLKYAIFSSKEQESDLDTTPARFNLVNEFSFKRQLGSHFFVASNIAVSYIDSDVDNFITLDDESSSLALKSTEIFGANPGINSKVGVLYGGSLGLQMSRFGLSLDFDHIDRTFETFGRNFQITDVRTYSLKNRLQLFNNSIIINSRLGLQQNNLNDDKANTSTRWITNINLIARSSEGHTLTTNISNFNLEKENLYVVGQDSFSFSFSALTIGLSPQIIIGESRLIGNFNYTKNNNDRQDIEVDFGQRLILGSVIYEVPILGKTTLLQIGVNYSRLTSEVFSETLIGLTLGTQWQLGEKFRIDFRYNPNRNAKKQEDSYMTHVMHLQGNYAFSKKQNLFLSAYYQKVGGISALRDNQIRIGYRWKFTTKNNSPKN